MLSLLALPIAYLIGSIPFGYLIVKLTSGGDIRQTGSGGTGATNVSRRAGKLAGIATLVLDVSTGTGTRTPTGHYRIEREIDGYHRSELGVLYRPKYVVGGVAIHGYPSVPPTPASHGCVRTINPAMDRLWEQGLAPIGTPVWIHR